MNETAAQEWEALTAIYCKTGEICRLSEWKGAPIKPSIVSYAAAASVNKSTTLSRSIPKDHLGFCVRIDAEEIIISCHVLVPPQYPDTFPLVYLEVLGMNRALPLKEWQMAWQEQAQSLRGQVMCYDLIEGLRDRIREFAKTEKTSFHDQRLARQQDAQQAEQARLLADQHEVVEQLAKEAELLEKQIKQDLEEKEELLLAEQRRRKGSATSHDSLFIDLLEEIEPPRIIPLKHALRVLFPSLWQPANTTEQGVLVTELYLGTALGPGLLGMRYSVSTPLHSPSMSFQMEWIPWLPPQNAATVKRWNEAMQRIEKFRQITPSPHLLPLMEVMVLDKALAVIHEHPPGLSLKSLVTQFGPWCYFPRLLKHLTFQLIKAVAYLHANQFMHKSIQLESIYCLERLNEEVEPCFLLEGAVVYWHLKECQRQGNLTASNNNNNSINTNSNNNNNNNSNYSVNPKSITPPEVLERPSVYGRKADIFMIGIVLLQAALGAHALDKLIIYAKGQETVERLLNQFPNLNLCPAVIELASQLLNKDPTLRPTSEQLLKDSIWSKDPLWQLNETKRTLHTSQLSANNTIPVPVQSRYRTDFEEQAFLGRGGFGSVVQARNRLDDRVYAIKRVSIDNTMQLNRVLREVVALSRLQHPHVVRYYQAWVEETVATGNGLSGLEKVEQASTSIPKESNFDSSSSQSSSASFSASVSQTSFNTNDFKPSLPNSDSEESSFSISFTDASQAQQQQENYSSKKSPTLKSNPTGATSSSLSHSHATHAILYIQMEYCPNNTLRNVIDQGALPQELIWRYFRQMCQGLAHIHAQGLMHRDLKPSNVFLDGEGRVKIGDFGLATSVHELPETDNNNGNNGNHHKNTNHGNNTSQIGTLFYSSPEQCQHLPYNYKVDMYALGIILFEMTWPFNTAMERVHSLQRLRLAKIEFPNEYPNHFQKERQVIQLLLTHSPQDRPNAQELLNNNELLPPLMEDEFVQEAIRTMTVSNTVHFNKLMTTLFSNTMPLFKDFTFDAQSWTVQEQWAINAATERMRRVFEHLGAESLSPLLFVPKVQGASLMGGSLSTCFLDATGQVLSLPSDPFLAFARWISRQSDAKCFPLKRYSFDKVYRTPLLAGCQPVAFHVASFDLIYEKEAHEEDLETSHVMQLLLFHSVHYLFQSFQWPVVCHVNHIVLVEYMWRSLNISDKDFATCHDFLCQSPPWPKCRNWLVQKMKVNARSVDAWMEWVSGPAMSLNDALIKWRSHGMLTDKVQRVFDELMRLERESLELGLSSMSLSLGWIPSQWRYFSLMMQWKRVNQAHSGSNSNNDWIAQGGRYDALLKAYQSPVHLSKKSLMGIGVQFSLTKFISSNQAPSSPFLCIAALGQRALYQERCQLYAELLPHFKCHVLMHPLEMSVEWLMDLARERNATHLLLVKSLQHRVKIKSLNERKKEEEVMRHELIPTLQQMMNLSSSTSSSAPNISTSTLTVIMFPSVPIHKLSKPMLKYQERLVKQLSQMKPSFPLLFCSELSREFIRKLIDFHGDESSWKKWSESQSNSVRESAVKLKMILKQWKEEKFLGAWIASGREERLEWIELS